MAIIGIDLGTTNSLAAVWKENKCLLIPNSFGEYLTPSVVGVDDDGTILVGKIAKERLITHPAQTAASFKRFMGTEKTFSLGGRSFTPEELSSFVLQQLKRDAEAFLGERVEEAVISVPAYFNDNGRLATKLAGKLAGLRVDRLINEPSAAALACRMAGEEAETFLVFDFGGGTLDVSIVDAFENVVEILAVSGDNHLGGDDFDLAIAESFCRENGFQFKDLDLNSRAIVLKQAEQCKMSLTTENAAAMVLEKDGRTYSMALTNQRLISMCPVLLKRMEAPLRRVLRDSELTLREIDEIVMVGGSSRMPVVQKYLEHVLGKAPLCSSAPEAVIARGCGVVAGIKARAGEVRDMLLTDICPFSLGVATMNHENPDEPLFSPIIERNTSLPASRVNNYSTVHDNQTQLKISIYQGESRYCRDNLNLGEMQVTVPPKPRGEEGVDVRFTYDINGILEVEVTNNSTGIVANKLILNRKLHYSDNEIAQKLKELSRYKVHPREFDENRLVLARGERLYAETLRQTREAVGERLDWFQRILSTQQEHKIRRAREYMTAFFDRVEESDEAFEPFSPDFDAYDEEE